MKQMYCCEICGTAFETKEECEKCEQFHIIPDGIEAGMFLPFNSAKSPYIQSVLLRMKDNKLVRYVFDSVMEQEPIMRQISENNAKDGVVMQ